MNGARDDHGAGKRRSRWGKTPTDSAAASGDVWERDSVKSRRERREGTGGQALSGEESGRTAGDGFESEPAWPDTGATEGSKRAGVRIGPSLKNRALAYLARREHSRVELARKLARHVQENDPPGALEAVIDDLCAKGLVSDARFVDAVVRKRAGGFGSLKIMSELKQHALDDELIGRVSAELRASEWERARQVWRKKFATPPLDAHERAKQMRFLASRGFSQEVVSRVLRFAGDAAEDWE